MINWAQCSSLLHVVKREMKMECRWDLQHVWMTGHLLVCGEHPGTESCGPQLWFRQTTLSDGETWIMIRLWVCLSLCHAFEIACSALVSEEQQRTCGGGKVCVCPCRICLGILKEYELNGRVNVCVYVHVTGVPTDVGECLPSAWKPM